MDHQQRITQYGDSQSSQNIDKVVEDLEKALRKEGFTGERAYRVLCGLLILKSHSEQNLNGKIVDQLSSSDSPHLEAKRMLESDVDLDSASNFASDLEEISEERLLLSMKILDGFNLSDLNMDVFGFFYGKFFSDVFRGESGKFFTPRQVVTAMVELADPRDGELIADPACGSGGFLVWASHNINNGNHHLIGNDNDPILSETAKANLYSLGEKNFEITHSDLFSGEYIPKHKNSMDVILANPPFSIEYTKQNIWDGFEQFDDFETVISDYLFLESAHHLLKPGGRLVSLFPMSMITNSNNEHFRKMLRNQWAELACITLPEGVFYPYSGTSAQACILVLINDSEGEYYQYPSLKANINQIGYDTSRKKYTPIDENDFDKLFNSDAYRKYSAIRNKVIRGES